MGRLRKRTSGIGEISYPFYGKRQRQFVECDQVFPLLLIIFAEKQEAFVRIIVLE